MPVWCFVLCCCLYESRPLSAAQAYDVTKFIDQHPGGRTQFIVAAGRDVSVIFRSYHKDETFK